MAKNEEEAQTQPQTQEEANAEVAADDAEEQGPAGYVADGAAYVLQRTSYKINAGAEVKGDIPDERFMEEVLRDSDEAVDPIRDAHPEENQPVLGIGPDDELPDTTGRAVLREDLREDRK